MAGSGNNQQFNPAFLTQNQQDLLMAALASNNGQVDKNNQFFAGQDLSSGGAGLDYSMATMDPSLFLAANADPALGNFDINGLNDQQFLDLMDSNGGDLAFNSFLPDGQMLDDGGDYDLDDEGDLHDKRKSPEDDNDDADPKRREGEEKSAKKPGRKPLTTEPTTKRKAQNRAAQRAFRERKEKHLKDLETKVTELEKSSESANHENALLRAHVSRLQVELREYRKRLSLTASLGRSPPLNGNLQSYLNNANTATTTTTNNNFQFDFPKFGGLPNLPFGGPTPSSTASPPATNGVNGARHNSADGRASPKSQPRGSLSSTGSPAKLGSIDGTQTGNTPQFTNDVSNLFGTPSSMGDNSFDTANGSETNTKPTGSESSGSDSRLFRFNATSSASPSASSVSQYGGQGPSSSCGTSPEPSHHSPATANKDSTLDTINEHGYACHTTADGEISFCEKLNMACGNIRDPQPRVKSVSNESPAPAAAKASTTTPGSGTETAVAADASNSGKQVASSGSGVGGIDYFANQNGGQFDPVLFGDYRDSNAAIIGDGDFTGGFFNDAMPSTDWGNTFNWNDLTGSMRTGLTPAVQKNNPLEQADFLVSGMEEDEIEVVPGEDTTKMLSCHKIWDVLQDRADFKSGDLDIDGLCSELRAKARCSESGVVIDQKDVDAALQRLPNSRSNSSGNVPTQN